MLRCLLSPFFSLFLLVFSTPFENRLPTRGPFTPKQCSISPHQDVCFRNHRTTVGIGTLTLCSTIIRRPDSDSAGFPINAHSSHRRFQAARYQLSFLPSLLALVWDSSSVFLVFYAANIFEGHRPVILSSVPQATLRFSVISQNSSKFQSMFRSSVRHWYFSPRNETASSLPLSCPASVPPVLPVPDHAACRPLCRALCAGHGGGRVGGPRALPG